MLGSSCTLACRNPLTSLPLCPTHRSHQRLSHTNEGIDKFDHAPLTTLPASRPTSTASATADSVFSLAGLETSDKENSDHA